MVTVEAHNWLVLVDSVLSEERRRIGVLPNGILTLRLALTGTILLKFKYMTTARALSNDIMRYLEILTLPMLAYIL